MNTTLQIVCCHYFFDISASKELGKRSGEEADVNLKRLWEKMSGSGKREAKPEGEGGSSQQLSVQRNDPSERYPVQSPPKGGIRDYYSYK